jgi:signal transduction histidine kinase
MTWFPASYRQRLPLSLSIAAVATAFLMALALGLQTLKNLREDQGRNALRLGHAMADVLIQALRHDDVWLAYSLLRGPEREAADATWILVDESGRIFASNRPDRYRVGQPLRDALPPLAEATPGQGAERVGPVRMEPVDWPANASQDQPRRVLRLSLASEGTQVGELLALLSDAPFLSRFREVLQGGFLVTFGVLAVLLPLGWLWGRRMASPLALLADCMRRAGEGNFRAMQCPVPQGDSEIGQLGYRFQEMVAALAEKQELEQQMLKTERLAAVGRVAAGVAHEINNPLGGMLVAIDTFRRRQPADGRTGALLDLLDRGLRQIQHAVSALLVEARLDGRHLTPEDIEDVRTLAQPKSEDPGANLIWENGLTEPLPLPANLVRQLLLNLMLNALKAVEPGGRVAVQVVPASGGLFIGVENTGAPLPPDRLDRLFEPYPSPRPDRQGLGLWVCYQICSQLGGTIEARTSDGPTQIEVFLPAAGELPHDR